MASYTDDYETIAERFYSQFPENIVVKMDNDVNTPEPDATWCRLSIQPGVSMRETMGATNYIQLGRVYLQIFVPAQHGPNEGWELAEVFSQIFRDWHSADYRIRFQTPEFRVSDAEQEYFTVICSIPYRAKH